MQLKRKSKEKEAQELKKYSVQPKWLYIYYILAAFDIFTVLVSLFVNHQIKNTYIQSIQVNQEWTNRLRHYSELSQLAGKVNAPGNDIFDSQNVPTESKRLQVAFQQFQTQVAAIRKDLKNHVNPEQSKILLNDLDLLETSMNQMLREANLIFDYFNQKQPEMAGKRMATMDRKYSQVNMALDKLRQNVTEIQQQILNEQKKATKVLEFYEYIVSILILNMISGFIFYGHKLSQNMALNSQLKERLIEDLQQTESNLKIKTDQLEEALHQVQQQTFQVVQNAKMASLGEMVAGVAHEVNNPVNFIHGNLVHAHEYTQHLLQLVELYQKHYPKPVHEIQSEIETIDLVYLREDLPKLIDSMEEGIDRIRNISSSLRIFSRVDSDRAIKFHLHQGIDSAILILKYRLKATELRSEIKVIKEYETIPTVECFPGQLNQVFINLLANAIDAIDDKFDQVHHQEYVSPTIWIKTNQTEDQNYILMRIKDNGVGMSQEVKQRIFEHIFTTKAVGKGTGLGLKISRKIIVEKHGGDIQINSVVGEGTEFIIKLPINQIKN